MSNESYAAAVAEQAAAKAAEVTPIEPAQSQAAEEISSEPAQETAEQVAAKEAEAERKAEKRRERRERKEFYEMKAKLAYLERERERSHTQEPPEQENAELDVDEIVERKLAEREQQKHIETIEQKKEGIFSKLEKSGDFDREDFLENVRVTPLMAEAILESDLGDKVVKHLYSNPEEAERIASLPLARQAVEIGKLEVKLSAAPAPVKKSGAPAPIAPINGKNVSSSGYSPDMSDADYAKARREKKLISR